MKITYLGTGAAEGVPAMFCRCETCEKIREEIRRGEYAPRTRSQILIDGEVGIDFSPEAYYHSFRFGVDLAAIKYLLITHSHMDHFYAHDFILRGYKYCSPQPCPLRIYGNEEVGAVFNECTRREMKPPVAQSIEFCYVAPFQPFSFGENREYTAVALKAQHSAVECAYVYLLEKEGKFYLHLTDTGRLPEETFSFLEGYMRQKGKAVDYVTFDCTFLFYCAGEILRHMGLPDNAAMKEEFLRRKIVDGHTMYAITHFSHNSAPTKENISRAEKEYGFRAAYDGMSVEF